MGDFMTRIQRSNAMSAVRATDTKIEKVLRSQLHRDGFRFRKNVKELPGRPDIVLPKHRTVIFVNGCFWHHHMNCKRSKLPETRSTFWAKKIGDNIKRDQRQAIELRREGWQVLVVWECELKDPKIQEKVIEKLVIKLKSKRAD